MGNMTKGILYQKELYKDGEPYTRGIGDFDGWIKSNESNK